MFDRDLLAAVMAVMPRMRGPAMQGVMAYDFFSAGPQFFDPFGQVVERHYF